MISLVINSKCNQRCEYCFAYDTLNDNNNIMSLDTVRQILGFQLKAADPLIRCNVGIVGGEPTVHPQFQDILDMLSGHFHNNYVNSVIFTNGTKLYDYDIDNTAAIHGLINVNHPDIVGINNYNNTCKSIEKYIYGKEDPSFNIGVNIYPGLNDYSFIFNTAKQYGISTIRASVVCPDGKFKNMQGNREAYFKNSVEPFIAFCRQAIDNGIKISMDCCKIPACYFTEEQKNIVRNACLMYPNIDGNIDFICMPHIDIHPDLSVTHCFMRPEQIYMTDFDTPEELSSYVYNKWILPMHEGMRYGKCESCNLFSGMICNGGCLRFSRKEV